MAHNGNGSGHNGHGDGEDPDEKLIRFPTLAERDMMRKIREKQEKEWREDYKNRPKSAAQPFFKFGNVPPFTKTMVIIFVAVHASLHLFMDPKFIYTLIYTFGFVPGYFTGAAEEYPYLSVLSPITYIFLHGSWVHLAFNALMMFAMGTFFERAYGARATAVMFFACGLAGAAACLLLNPFSNAPVIGASGSISGLFGAVTILMYQQRSMGRIAKRKPVPLILFWALFIVVMGVISGDTSWQAHIGGFLGGVGMLYLMQKKKINFR
jgi:membrane associated rhomboid family serine protease